MKKILITDLHFGVHQNSMMWFKSQIDFFENQFFNYLSKENIVYCLGDVFDVRTAVNSKIAMDVRDLFTKIASLSKHVYIIGGNHDYFSPDTDRVCNLDLILGNIDGITLVTHEILELGDDVLIPWNDQENIGISELSKTYKGKTIFTHADLVSNKAPIYTTVYSGHIHTPYFDSKRKNLGAFCPMTFTDANEKRGFYTLNDVDNDLQFIPNKWCINYWRLRGDEYKLKEKWKEIKERDYIEIYVSQDNLYNSDLLDFKKDYPHLSIIPFLNQDVYESYDIDQDIESVIKNNIPKNLRDVFRSVKKIVKSA